jgi:hypothetical protein
MHQMPHSITLWDTSLSGVRSPVSGFEMDGPVTLRRLLENRVRQEVRRYNANLPEVFEGLVQPEDSERMLNGYRMPSKKFVDEDKQVAKAIESFERNGFVVLVNDTQVESLDQELEPLPGLELEFLKLVPLVGG